MKPTRHECGCIRCKKCSGTGWDRKEGLITGDKCNECGGSGTVGYCYHHAVFNKWLDDDDKKRYDRYLRKQAA